MKIGIDFGSTYSTVAAYNAALDRAEPLILVEGEPASIPSVVSINKKGQITCGLGAKVKAGTRNVRIFEAFKMLLTEEDQELLAARGYDGVNSPRSITRAYLEDILRAVVLRFGRNGQESVEEVTICVPEIWVQNVRKQDGRAILRDILLHELSIPVGNVRVVTEPEAASAFFAFHFERETGRPFNGHLLLIDYGGGTLDITLTQVSSDGKGVMEIGYREGGGAGENHPDGRGRRNIGSAGIAFMQTVLLYAMWDQGLLARDRSPDYTDPAFIGAVRDLESQLKNASRIKEIEDVFGSYGSGYEEIAEIMEDEPLDFVTVSYEEEDLQVTFQHLYAAYRDVIESVLRQQLEQINRKVAEHIHADPCSPAAGLKGDFKIALVGGFGSFYLVRKQLAEVYNLDSNDRIDPRTKNISADKRELAISLGAALIAAGRLSLQKTARYAVGLYSAGRDGVPRLSFGIRYHQTVEPGRPYFLCWPDAADDSEGNRMVFSCLRGNLDRLAIEASERGDHAGLRALRPEILQRLRELPRSGLWHVAFSMDESEILSLCLIACDYAGKELREKQIVIPLDSCARMLESNEDTEVSVE